MGHNTNVAVVVHVDLATRGLADLDVGLGASGRDLRNGAVTRRRRPTTPCDDEACN